ncbi:hypothetical protein BOA8489_03447 [Boseongicola aestuarii]|uniref:Uncharacterized protein n=1 Tax=Boseongicola aestuarii TaxID=1470561 RepID=A0A238J3P2_9RHOB|nr:hypothetical protein BOA8489_03447 [Boseongicola aestuarii]
MRQPRRDAADPRHQMTAAKSPPLHLRIKRMLETLSGGTEQILMNETRKSWVFLTSLHAYKLKKRFRDDLQDLTSLRARLDNALVEVDLNRRLARSMYLGVVKLCEHENKTLNLDGLGRTIDWLVKMKRISANHMLDERITALPNDPEKWGPAVDRLAEILTDFYQTAPRSNLRAEELSILQKNQQDQNETVLFDPLFTAHQARFSAVLTAYNTVFEWFLSQYDTRAAQGWIRDCPEPGPHRIRRLFRPDAGQQRLRTLVRAG